MVYGKTSNKGMRMVDKIESEKNSGSGSANVKTSFGRANPFRGSTH